MMFKISRVDEAEKKMGKEDWNCVNPDGGNWT
jgi:hypothetical protein